MKLLCALAASTLLVVGCAASASPQAAGPYLLLSAEIDGAPVSLIEGNTLEIDGKGFIAAGACNGFSGQFDGDVFSKLADCLAEDGDPDLNAIDDRMRDAIGRGPELAGDQLVFHAEGVRLVYGKR